MVCAGLGTDRMACLCTLVSLSSFYRNIALSSFRDQSSVRSLAARRRDLFEAVTTHLRCAWPSLPDATHRAGARASLITSHVVAKWLARAIRRERLGQRDMPSRARPARSGALAAAIAHRRLSAGL